MDSQAPVRKTMPGIAAVLVSLCLEGACGSNLAAADQYADLVRADKPAGYWRLQQAEDGRVVNEIELPDSTVSLDGAITGEVRLASSGPRSNEFPLFEPDNAAAEFAGGGALIRIKDPGEASPLDFKNGDAITLEAWVNPESVGAGRFLYILGKGRTETSGELSITRTTPCGSKRWPGTRPR